MNSFVTDQVDSFPANVAETGMKVLGVIAPIQIIVDLLLSL